MMTRSLAGLNRASPGVIAYSRLIQAVFTDDRPGIRFRTIHGYRRAYRIAGSGPALLLLHGIGDSSESWMPLLPALSGRYTVIAPDLLGHGQSDKPRADYAIGAFANGMRDLLNVLEIERATVVGHSFGGGVAAQFAYQFPEMCERLVLVATGGGGPQVSAILRLATAPFSELALPLLGLAPVRAGQALALAALRMSGAKLGRDADEIHRVLGSLPDTGSRVAFTRTLRSAVDGRGQVITMLDRCYLTESVPLLVIWGSDDAVIPVEHAHLIHEALPNSRLVIFDGAGHFPHRADPVRFLGELCAFVDSTEPAQHDPEEWRRLLLCGRPESAAS
jgi:pimeloyl-ACP methyl ester carboxylesterase